MKIFFSKNNNYFFFGRNVGIEPTPRTGMFVFYLLNLFRKKVPPVGLEPTQALLPIRFSYHYSFHYQLKCYLHRQLTSAYREYLWASAYAIISCLWSGLGLNHIEFCARLMCIVIDGLFLLLRVPIFHHEDYYFPTSMSVHTHLSFNLGSSCKVSTHCLTNVTVPYIFNAYLRTTFRITLARR